MNFCCLFVLLNWNGSEIYFLNFSAGDVVNAECDRPSINPRHWSITSHIHNVSTLARFKCTKMNFLCSILIFHNFHSFPVFMLHVRFTFYVTIPLLHPYSPTHTHPTIPPHHKHLQKHTNTFAKFQNKLKIYKKSFKLEPFSTATVVLVSINLINIYYLH